MNKNILFFSLMFICLQGFAGDSAKINTHNKVVIKTDPGKGYTNYPAWGHFPDAATGYRKVYLYLEFGCAPGLKCGEWDYINQIFIGRKGGVKGDSLNYEISRFITPYGFNWNSAQKWKHGWYFDLTDFSSLLHDSVEIIYQHSGYEGNTDRGWTVTMDFVCVKGDPARIPMGLNRLHQLSAPYGDANNTFASHVTEKSFTMPTGADMAAFKIIQTGHGMDAQENCSEFCSKKRTVKLDNNIISEKNVWRDDCGMNSLYPQAGTWVYDRAGWCPGAPVLPFDLYTKLASGTQHTFSLDMESYINTTGGSANYVLTDYAFFFKDNTKPYDAAIEDILAPSAHLDYLRYNPICSAPLIKVKNMGSETLTAIEFEYGKLGGTLQKIWVPCHILPFESQVLTLESIYNWSGAGNTFVATITKVNNQQDAYTADNTMYSQITNSTMLPNKIIVVLKTNNAPSQNYYTITDARGKIIRSKDNFAANTIYRDTVILDNNVCYTFNFMDDGPASSSVPLNKNGLEWWADKAQGSGYLQLRNGNNNAMLKSFNADFGTQAKLDFHTTYTMGNEPVINASTNSIQVDVMPNPAAGLSTVYLDFADQGAYQLQVFDITGRNLFTQAGNSLSTSVPLPKLPAGIYHVLVTQGTQVASAQLIVE
jgi:hypothetical protein